MNAYAIGLDLGISSVGWAVVALNDENNPCGILDMGSRIFDCAEHPKTGASLALPRREARSARRRLRRHRHRNDRIRNLLVHYSVVTESELATLFNGKLEDIYALRLRALDELVTGREMARILIHLAQRRGFRSNRKSGVGEDGKLLEAVSENARRMQEKGYRTVGEMLCQDPAYQKNKRNKGGSYLATVSRDLVEDEVHSIFEAQRRFSNILATEELENCYLHILLSQRSFDEGPGGNSPYGGNQIEKMVGNCTFEAGEKRAAKATYSFEYFSLLEKLNHIRLVNDGKSVPLTAQQREDILQLVHKTADLNYFKIRKALALDEKFRFNTVRYSANNIEECEKKEKFTHLRQYHKMRKAFKERWNTVTVTQRNAIAQALTYYKTSENIRKALAEQNFTEEDLVIIEQIGNFSGFGHLSVKACEKIIPYLEQGLNYNEACAKAGYEFRGHCQTEKTVLLYPTDDDYADITSPVAKRSISQAIKVVNAIIRSQGCSPVFLNIELAREMAKDFAERKKLDGEMRDNAAYNERLAERIRKEYGVSSPTGQDIIKLRLYEEQTGVCAYSLKQISAERLFEPNYVEIDHIIPYSISFDDSRSNKALVLAEENRNKGNRLPLQYLTGQRRDSFIVWTNSQVRNYRKRQNLLKEEITKEDEEKFIERNLQDTKTASRFLLNYINDHLLFAPTQTQRKRRVTAVNGCVTSHMRKRWGIGKIRADGDLHHAVDALVVACTTNAMIQSIRRYSQWRECRYTPGEECSFAIDERTGEIIKEFPYPWPLFRQELNARLSSNPTQAVIDAKIPFYLHSGKPLALKPLFVSRVPQRKVTGAAHKDTVRSGVMMDEGYTVTKTPLTSLKLDKDGEIQGYYAPESDRLLYQALKEQLTRYGGNAKKAFAEPFYKPKHDGSPGPEVRKVKICEKTSGNVKVQGGVAAHDSMVRVDVFHIEDDGYYLVPVYVADTVKPSLPNRACIAGKRYEEWRKMDDKDFVFSLYPNDLIRITHRSALKLQVNRDESSLVKSKQVKSALLYYTGMNRATGAINGITHDGAYVADGIGAKTLVEFQKYTVDVLGEYHLVKQETRQPFTIKRG